MPRTKTQSAPDRRAHRERTRQLGRAVSEMATRRVSSAASYASATGNRNRTWAGKPADYYRRAESRQLWAMLRLLWALEAHANKEA